MDQSFGARLRSQRERRQIALSAIAEQSKIRVSLLEGLERDDLSQWPGGIFRRSYVRTYAQAIGLDPDAVVREFLERHPEPVEDDMTSAIVAARGLPEPGRPRTRLELLLGSAIQAIPTRRHPLPPRDPAPVFADPARHEPAPVVPEPASVVAARPPVVPERAGVDPPWSRLAAVCTMLAKAAHAQDVRHAAAEAVRALDAKGMILWVADQHTGALAAGLAHGYADQVVSALPRVGWGDDNPVAAAFRAADILVVDRSGSAPGAIVVPVINACGCVGVLAFELSDGTERNPLVRVMATVLAAQFATLVAPVPTMAAATA